MADYKNIQHFILATAGHVDHGKSSLVKALTGIDPDRLPEEKARGITIDLGFAHLELPAPSGAFGYTLGIVDVPGHEDFVKNMVAGVGSIDLALIVVAADDGWMPQTEEHLQILTYLGVARAVVALSKIDLVSTKEELAVSDIRERLANSLFAQAPIVKTSVYTGRGIQELKGTLAQALADTPPPADFGKPRLPVDRVFTLHGIGTVVTGTLAGGKLQRGQPIVVQPSGRTSRIRNIQSHNRDVEVSLPGTRTALNLPDLQAQTERATEGIRRGDVITLPGLGGPSTTLDILLERSPRLLQGQSRASRPLKDGTLARVHLGSANVPARLLLLGADHLSPGERGTAQLRLEAPLFAFAGDRFIVRDWAEQVTLAGGIILDPDASREQLRSEARRTFLQQRAEAPRDQAAFITSQLGRDGAVLRAALLLKFRSSHHAIEETINRLAKEGKIINAGEFVADAYWWRSLRQHAIQAIDTEHRTHPERSGLPLIELRAAVDKLSPPANMFNALLEDLCRNEFVQAGSYIRRTEHRPALPAHLQSAGSKVRSALAAKPLEPPSRKELAPDNLSQQALRFLLETGEAIEISPEIILLTEAFQRAAQTIKTFLVERRSATVSELRQALGTSRRIVVPLLERLDKEGVTVRQGDQRILRGSPKGA